MPQPFAIDTAAEDYRARETIVGPGVDVGSGRGLETIGGNGQQGRMLAPNEIARLEQYFDDWIDQVG